MPIPVGRKAKRFDGLTGCWRAALLAAGVGIMAGAPMGCTLSMTLRKESSGETQPAQVKADKNTKPEKPVTAVAMPPTPTKSKAALTPRTAARGTQYLPDSLIDDGSNEPIQRPTAAGKIVNVFGEFTGTGHAKLAMDPSLQQVTFPEAGYDTEPSVSSATKAVVFSSTRGGERAQIYLQKPGSAAVTQLTDAAGDSAQPSFSPDGSRIAFCSNRTGNWHLYLMDADGRHVTRITEGPTQDMHPSFNPDGGKLAYCSLSPASDQWEIWTIDVATGVKKTIGRGLFPSWSPDRAHSRIAFQKTRAKGSRWFSLWTVDVIEDQPANLCEIALSANAALVGPAWSPDGKRLVFSAIVEPGETRNGKPKGEQDVWVCGADGSDRQRLTDGTGANLGACWAVDKRVYFVSDRSGPESIWSLPVRAGASGEESVVVASEEPNRKREPGSGEVGKSSAPGGAASVDPSELNK